MSTKNILGIINKCIIPFQCVLKYIGDSIKAFTEQESVIESLNKAIQERTMSKNKISTRLIEAMLHDFKNHCYDAIEIQKEINNIHAAYADMERQRDELLDSADIDDAVCMADGHHHKNIVEEKICSLRFQRDAAIQREHSAVKRAEDAARKYDCTGCKFNIFDLGVYLCYFPGDCIRQAVKSVQQDYYTPADSAEGR